MKPVLVAVSLSADPDPAIRRGVDFADRLGTSVIVVHAVGNQTDDQRLAEADSKLTARLAAIRPPRQGEINHSVLAGEEGDAIATVARTCDAALIVLGEHRHGLLRDLFGSSTVHDVMKETHRAVLVAAGEGSPDYRRVVVAVDFSPASRRALDTAMKLFPDVELKLVHAYDAPFPGFITDDDARVEVKREHADELAELLREVGGGFFDHGAEHLRAYCALRQGEPVSVIVREVRDQSADLLVIGTRGRGGLLSSAPFGSVAQALLESPPCDVLAVPER